MSQDEVIRLQTQQAPHNDENITVIIGTSQPQKQQKAIKEADSVLQRVKIQLGASNSKDGGITT